jgi:hypothetical protein
MLMRKQATGRGMVQWNVLHTICAVTFSFENTVTEDIAACFRHADSQRAEELEEPGGWGAVSEKLGIFLLI